MATLSELFFRKHKMISNGKNSEGQGVLRKIDRHIRKLENQSK